MANRLAGQAPQPRLLYSYIAQPQFYSDHHHPDRQNTPDGPISVAFTRSSRRSIHTNNDLVKGVVHVKAQIKIKHVTISFVGKTTCRIFSERNPANQHISEVELFRREQTLSRIETPSPSCPSSRVEYPFEFRFPEAVENDARLQNDAPFRADASFEHGKAHPLPPSLWWNESTICNEYFLRAEFVTENASFTLNPVVVQQLRFSPSVPERGLLPMTALVPTQPIRLERKSRLLTPESPKERRAPLKRLKTGLRGGSKEEEASSTSLLVLSVPPQYRVGASSRIKLSLQATLSDGDTQPAPVYVRGIRAQAIAHINFRIPLASAPNGEIRKESIGKFDLFNKRYSKPGIKISSDTLLQGFEINSIVPPTFKTYGVALRYDVKYDLLLECAGKESEHEVDMANVVIEPMARPGGHLGPPEELPLVSGSDESFELEGMMRDVDASGLIAEQPPPYYT